MASVAVLPQRAFSNQRQPENVFHHERKRSGVTGEGLSHTAESLMCGHPPERDSASNNRIKALLLHSLNAYQSPAAAEHGIAVDRFAREIVGF